MKNKNVYTEQNMIDFAEWIDENDLAKISWKNWKTTAKYSDCKIDVETTKELIEVWKTEKDL